MSNARPLTNQLGIITELANADTLLVGVGVDSTTATALILGGTTSTSITLGGASSALTGTEAVVIGKTGTTTHVLGDLKIDGSETVTGTATMSSNVRMGDDAGDTIQFDGRIINATTGDANDSLIFLKNDAHEITVDASTTATNAGGALTISSGDGATTGAGGNLTLVAGAGGSTDASVGGNISISGGTSTATNGDGGDVSITGGAGTGTGTDGDLNIGTTNTTNIQIGSATTVTTLYVKGVDSGLNVLLDGTGTTGDTSGAAAVGVWDDPTFSILNNPTDVQDALLALDNAISGASTPTLQNVYDNDAGAPAQVDLTAADGAILFRDNATPITGTLFAVQSTGGAETFLNVRADYVGMSQDLIFDAGSAHFIDIADSTAAVGGALTVNAGGGDAANAGGALNLVGGAGGANGAGGVTNIDGGAGGSTSGAGGDVTIDGGAVVSGTVGSVLIGQTTAATVQIDGDTEVGIQVAAAGAINVGTDAFAATITVGNITGVSALNLKAGSAGLDIDSDGASVWDFASSLDVNAAGAVTIDAVGNSNFTVDTGNLVLETTVATGIVDINSITSVTIDATTSALLNAGSGNLTFGALATPAAITLNETGDLTLSAFYTAEGESTTSIIGALNSVKLAKNIHMERITDAPTSTYYSVQHMQDIFHSSGQSAGGEITNPIGSPTYTVDVAAGSGFLRSTNDPLSTLYYFNWPVSNGLPINSEGIHYIGVEYNAGDPQVVSNTTNAWDFNTNFPLGVVVRENTEIHVLFNSHAVGDHASAMIRRMWETMPLRRDERTGGLILNGEPSNQVSVTAGALWERLERFAISAISAGTTFYTYQGYDNLGTTNWTKTSVTAWTSDKYNNITLTTGNELVTLTASFYSNHWFYLEPDGTLYMQYGQQEFPSQAGAEAEGAPTIISFHNQGLTKLIGRLTYQQGATTVTSVASVFEDVLTTQASSDHGGLTGLADDDHNNATTGYVIKNGTATRNTMTGSINMGTRGTGSSELFKLTTMTGVPTGLPTGSGHLTWNSSANTAYVYNGSGLASGWKPIYSSNLPTFTLDAEISHTLQVGNSVTAATAGGALSLRSGDGTTTAAGGNVSITSGSGGTTSAGGNLNLTAGIGGSTDAAIGGAVNMVGGTSAATNGVGGLVNIDGGAGTGTGAGGAVTVDGGVSPGGTAGAITVGGTASGTITIGRAASYTANYYVQPLDGGANVLLSATTANGTSGAAAIGVYGGNLAYSGDDDLQDVLEALDAAIVLSQGTTTITALSGAAFKVGSLVAIENSGGTAKLFPVNPDIGGAFGGVREHPIGIAKIAATAADESIEVIVAGEVTLPTAGDSLWDTLPVAADVGRRVYASNTTDGEFTMVAPSGSGVRIHKVGILTNATGPKMLVQVGEGMELA